MEMCSKINYLDPRFVSLLSLYFVFNLETRITAAWCQIHNVPIEKMFSKTLVTKCEQAPFKINPVL